MDHHVLLQILVLLNLAWLVIIIHIFIIVFIVLKDIFVCKVCVDLNSRSIYSFLGRDSFFLVRTLGLLLAGWLLLLSLLLDSHGSFLPFIEQQRDIIHSMVGVEQSCHRVQQVLIVMQVLLLADFAQLELIFDIFVLQSRVAIEVLN